MVHEIAFNEFFKTDFYICDFLREEILLRDNEVPLTAVYTGNSLHGLWDNDWIQDPWENLSDDETDDVDINPLQLNPLQAHVGELAIIAHHRQISEYENGGPVIRHRFPHILFRTDPPVIPYQGSPYQQLFTSHLIPVPTLHQIHPKTHFHL
ncbi:hypothetical protein M422DRAFT_266338 [Sphaerobolus stellatus SS14]|uniref:Uncharacterized protein n=1 Tax=Sphaerobolus stellatus (strain SS14) TaxID=990650 RepID=A0A0C9V373_SPHS4|nr:hypothetical protein M422DRAFT_266338 [Sphaerobolus stellatus SS14]